MPAPTDAPTPADPDAARRAAEEFVKEADVAHQNRYRWGHWYPADAAIAALIASPLPGLALALAAEVERLRLVRDTSLAHARRLARAARRALDDRRDGGRADLGPLWEAMGEFAAFHEGLTGEEKGGDRG